MGESRITPETAAQFTQGNHAVDDEILFTARASIERLTQRLPQLNRASLFRLEELPLEEQAHIFREVGQAEEDSELFFLELYLARKLLDTRFANRHDPYFTDPLIHRVERGHRVLVIYEVPEPGKVSRHQARFLRYAADRGNLVVVDPDNPDVQNLGIDWKSGGQGFRKTNLGGNPLERGYPQGIQGLYQMFMDSPHEFKTGDEAAEIAEGQIGDTYRMEVSLGTIMQPPRPNNEAVMLLEDGTEVEMTNVRFIALVGVNEAEFLNRGADELYIHRPVRVWHEGKWHKGKIDQISAHGLVGVRCDERIAEEGFLDGHGLAVQGRSFELDLSDPASPEKYHPLLDYPRIRIDNCVLLFEEGEPLYGWIENYNVNSREFLVNTPYGPRALSFDAEFIVIDTPESEQQSSLVKRGNRFKVWNARDRKFDVHEIKGVDRDNDLVIGRKVSNTPGEGMYRAGIFDIRATEMIGSLDEAYERFPFLKRADRFEDVTVRFRCEGRILEGKVLNAKSAPAYIQVIIEKQNPPKGFNADLYDRYDVELDDILGEVEKKKS